MTLEDIIIACIAERRGDKSFELWHSAPIGWVASIGVGTRAEDPMDISSRLSETPRDAALDLLAKIRTLNSRA